ncbi:hypothetical protein TWF970_008847 [Orbilia oligospora]|uniref:Uncharacterized protein n=1 Tax=Orbilia oligospora TaxID=2813651 RepID=A0A7C8VME7_ORBOL|nr:hypothetical protein TWF970_008847 [Orbilia oligospora]
MHLTDERSSIRQGYELLASTATLKASVNENKDKGYVDNRIPTSINENQSEMQYLRKGLTLSKNQAVYVKIRDYCGPPLEPTSEQKQQAKRHQKRAYFLVLLSMNTLMAQNYSKLDMDQIYEYDDSDDDEDVELIELVRLADSKLRILIKNFYNIF